MKDSVQILFFIFIVEILMNKTQTPALVATDGSNKNSKCLGSNVQNKDEPV